MKREYTNSPVDDENGNSVEQSDNDKKEKKPKIVEKKSPVPILAVGITFIGLMRVFPVHGFFALAINIIIASLVYKFVKKLFPNKKIESRHYMEDERSKPVETTLRTEPEPPKAKSREEKEEQDETTRLLDKIDRYNTNIKLLNDAIRDEYISKELYGIEDVINKIKYQMKEYKSEGKPMDRAIQLGQFFDYYMPTIIKILNSYRRIEKNNLTGDNARETKKRIMDTLPVIKRAFEKELDNMFSDEMLDITTDIVVLESMLSKDGLVDGMKNKNDF